LKILSYVAAAIAGIAAAALAFTFLPSARQALAPYEKSQIEAVVQSYIEAHPEIVAKALDAAQAQRKAAELREQRASLRAKADAIFRDPSDPVLGNPAGDVTIVEFFDYRCPYCKRSMPDVMQTVNGDGHIRLVLKEFPILGPNSVLATRAALASIQQGKYAPFHEAMLASKSELNEGAILALAEANGIDTKRLTEDMKSPAIDALIKKNYRLADDLKIEGTPVFIIGDRLIPGAVDKSALERLVQEARKKG